MVSKRTMTLGVIGGAAAVFGYMLYASGGRTPSVSLQKLSTGSSYDPYAHWAHTSGGGPCHLYPDVIGRNVLALVPQTEDMGLSLQPVEVNYGAAAAQ